MGNICGGSMADMVAGKIFDMYAGDDGLMSAAEVDGALQQVQNYAGMDIPQSAIQAALSRVDRNGDGLDKDEFTDLVAGVLGDAEEKEE